ncbi:MULTISPECIES: esterase-like activity of phytase family protein [Novosphingobium]|uniref:esterase-like activity of phytase family protein n=2 Tax=Novosphingobium TaxID=165696 RepID=UPI00254A2B25|nr:esterase-like activity of phytase family protein [Novosphingobium sp. fls2-241-R2A-195]
MRRSIPLLALAVPLLWVTWGRTAVPPGGHTPIAGLEVERQVLPSNKILARYLGPFRMESAWQYRSKNPRVAGYSALVAKPGGRLLAFSDAGGALYFAPPGERSVKARALWLMFSSSGEEKAGRDVESVATDPATGRYWAALEGSNRIVRLSPILKETDQVAPRAMALWGINTGAEAMTRLPDGRFVAIREIPPSLGEPRLHEAVLFSGDPIEHPNPRKFFFDGPDNFSVVDMTLLPDGRALILMRRLIWPLPMRFAGRIVIADTALIRPGKVWHSVPLASLASVLPVDNFEAIAAVPRPDGRITVWLMSDDNAMRVLQRTLLWKLSVDPKQLPWPK